MIPIVLRTDVPEPLAVQIVGAIRTLVASGALAPGEAVPSSRALAQQLSVSRGTVVAAYDQLVAESYFVTTPGGKTRIHPKASARVARGHDRDRAATQAAWTTAMPSARASGASGPQGASTQSVDPSLSSAGKWQSSTSAHHVPNAQLPPNAHHLPNAQLPLNNLRTPRTPRDQDQGSLHAGVLTAEANPSRTRPEAGGQPHRRESRKDLVDLTPHVHQPVIVDDSSWREAWRAAATPAPGRRNDPREATQGLAELRSAIAEHLRLMRSMVVDPDDIFVTTGARDGLALALSALVTTPHVESDPANSRISDSATGPARGVVGVESPGYPGLRRVLARAAVPTIDLPVDEYGVILSELPRDCAAILVTPNHLFPVGGSMPAPRRLGLLALAQERGVLVIEDDLDSEYRHVGAVMPSLWELAPQSVIHLGTFNQVLTPDARMGYLIAPPHLHAELAAARGDLGSGASAIAQRAVASYLHGGGLRRNLIRKRRDIVRRRDAVSRALGPVGVQMNAGANAIIELPDQATSDWVQEVARARGVLVGDLAHYWSESEPAPVAGVVIAYGDQIFDDMVRSANTLADVIGQAMGR